MPHNQGMSLAQACAEVGATIERARSLFAETPQPATAADTAAGHLSDASASTATAGQATAELSGEMVNTHRGFVGRAAGTLSQAAGTDTRLSAQAGAAAEITRSGALRLTALAQESRATAQAATTVKTPAGQRAILAALKSQVDRTHQVISETRQRAGELAADVGLLDYPLEPPPTPASSEPV